MAFNSHHSAGYSDGLAGNNSIDASGSTDSISWADIQKSLDSSSLTGANYGRGSVARSSEVTAVADATPAPTLQSDLSSGFGLVQAGVSPFRGLDPNGDFYSNSAKRYQDVRSNFQTGELAPTLAEPRIGSAPKLNSSLLRVIGNLQKRDAGSIAETTAQVPGSKSESQQPEAKLNIGLAISENSDIHQPGRVARAVVRLEPTPVPTPEVKAEAPAPIAERTDRRVSMREASPEPVKEVAQTNPISNPFKYVADQHSEIREKFDGSNVKYGRTTLLPDGRVVQVQTASDNTTLTETKGEQGANSLVVHDRYRRPITEQHTDSDGTWSFSNLSYNDSNGVKPFCSEKLTVNSDGSVVKLRFSNMGQIQSRHTFA